MQGTSLAVGGSETHRSGQVDITIQHVRPGAYMTVVAYGSTGARVDQLTSGPWPTEDKARKAARNAYKAFASGRTVGQVIADLNDKATDQLHAAMRRKDRGAARRVADLNRVLDQIRTTVEVGADDDMIAGIRANIATQQASSFREFRDMHAAAEAADRAQLELAVTR
ncbi:hypothetical protein AB0B94_31060 [Micromonospora sp. NPDC048986]|uniref:hypothetical protein n=1 Tax=Micromonospora sp. NPDC048986 TaxID=3155644 RepID=UPI0033ED26EA